MKVEIQVVDAQLRSAGFIFAGLCNCASRARKYKKLGYTIKVFPSMLSAALSFQNKRITDYVPIGQIQTLIERATVPQPKPS